MYEDIKYFRLAETKIELTDGSYVTLPLLSALQEAVIIETIIKTNSPTLDFTDPQISASFYAILSVCGINYQDAWTKADMVKIYEAINREIIIPFFEFYTDENVKRFLDVKESKSKNDNRYTGFSLIQLITTILSKLNLSGLYEKYCGLRYCILASRMISDNEETSKIQWIPLLADAANMANYGVDRKKAKPFFQDIIKDHNKRMGFKEESIVTGGGGLSGLVSMIRDVEESGQSMTNAEYIEQKRKEYFAQSKKSKNN